MPPAAERFLLIERLDWWCITIVFIWATIYGIHYLIRFHVFKIKKPHWIFDLGSYTLIVAVAMYMYWRTFEAWRGIYY